LEALRNYWAGYAYSGISSGTSSAGAGASQRDQEQVSVSHVFVGGELTPEAFIATQIAHQTIAGSYSGYSSFYNQKVDVTVNFTDETFAGTWVNQEGGIGMPMMRMEGGHTAVEPRSFAASGNIVGQHIVADSITGEGVTGGILQGSFFGDQAQSLGGAYEVDTTDGTFNDVFSTVEEGTGTAPNVSERDM
jgi:hypothetical protein